MTFSSKIHKNMKKWPGDSKSEPKGEQNEPKVSQRESKVSQRAPKECQREPKGSQGERKGSSKVSQRATKIHSKIDLRKRLRKGYSKGGAVSIIWSHFGDIFHQKSMNKSVRKSMPKKSWKFMKNQCENGLDIYGNFDDCLNVASPKNEFSRKGVPTETIIFMQ